MSSADDRPQGDWLDNVNRNRQTLAYAMFGLAAACAVGTLVLVVKFKLDYAAEVLVLAVTALGAISGGIWLVTQPAGVSRRDADRMFTLFAGGFLGLMVTLYGLMLMLRWRSTLLGGTEQWQGEEGWKVWTSLSVFFIGLAVMFLGLMTAREKERSHATLRRLVYGYNAVLTSLLVLAILIVINILGYLYLPVVTDWTADQLYTISPDSRRVLEALEKPVKVFVLQSGRNPAVASDTRNLLSNFQSISNKLQVEYIAVHRQLDRQAELVNRYSLVEVEGVLVVHGTEPGADHRFIKEEDLMERPTRGMRDRTEGYTYKGEDAIITVLDYLSRGKSKTMMYFTQGNGELELGDMTANRLDRGLSALRERLVKGNHEVKGLQLGPAGSAKREDPNTVVADKVPEDANVVVVAGPRFQFPAETLKALTEYMNRTDPKTGAKTGRMIVLFDVNINREGEMVRTGLEKWLEGYGVEVGNGRILSAVPDAVGRVYPTRIVVSPNERLAASNDIAKQFAEERFAMLDARPVRPLKPDGPPMQQQPFRVEELLQTIYRRTWVEPNLRVAPNERVGEFVNKDRMDELDRLSTGPIPVAVAVSDAGSLPDDAAHRGVAAPAGKPRMVVFGDATLASNAVMHESSGMIYYDFFASCVGWLGERPQNIGIKAKKRDLYTMDQKTNLSRLIFLPVVLILAGAVGLGAGVWVVRRR